MRARERVWSHATNRQQVQLHRGDHQLARGLSVQSHKTLTLQAGTASTFRRSQWRLVVRAAMNSLAISASWAVWPSAKNEMHPAQVAQHWGVDTGLSEEEAAQRLRAHGANRPSSRPEQGAFKRWLAQLRQPLVLVLLVAAVVTALLGEWLDASVISAVVLVNALVGFIQEGKAQAALTALVRAVAADAAVLRAGSRRRLDAAQLVPGDVVLLAAGHKVPADLRVHGAKQLRTAEAALTGESTPMEKHHLPLQLDTLLADRRNMSYAGTLVLGGQATGLVVAKKSLDQQHRHIGLGDHALGHAAHHGRAQEAMAVGAHHHQVGFFFGNGFQDFLRWHTHCPAAGEVHAVALEKTLYRVQHAPGFFFVVAVHAGTAHHALDARRHGRLHIEYHQLVIGAAQVLMCHQIGQGFFGEVAAISRNKDFHGGSFKKMNCVQKVLRRGLATRPGPPWQAWTAALRHGSPAQGWATSE
jgi:hypothetical protein